MIPTACNLACDNLCALSTAALSHAFDAWMQTDDAGRIETCHVQTGGHFGWRANDVIGQHLHSILFSENDRQTCQQAFTQCLQHEIDSSEVYSIELQVRGDTGSALSAEVSMSRVAFKSDTKILVSLRDLTSHKTTQDNLRIAEAAFDLFEGLVVTDASKTIVKVNTAFTGITGYTAEEALGKQSSIFRADKTTDTIYHELRRVLLTERYWQGEVWDRRKNGERYPAWLRISAVFDPDGVVSHYVISFVDNTAQHRSDERIHRLAFFDSLTELPNRRLLMDRLKRACHRSHRQHNLGAVLVIDLDNFKDINDALGHDAGDDLLKLAAHRLKECLKSDDTIARVDGDEFVIVLESLSGDHATAISRAELVANRARLALLEPSEVAGHALQMSISIGVTLLEGHVTSESDLLKHAETAMYQAKDAGRGCVRFFNSTAQQSLQKRFEMIVSMRKGFPEQFTVHYQLQVNTRGEPQGVEALIRWHHPSLGNVSPAMFIPLAEETEFVIQLGTWVLRTACRQLVAWSDHPLAKGLTMAVNVSAKQFHRSDFVQTVKQVIQETGAKPNQVKLELTEGLMLHDVTDVIEKMLALREIGVGFSIDDFGTGYSSLSYLKRLPLDQIKIDKSFVHDLKLDPDDQSIARTVVTLGHSLGLNVIAEGVETEQQRDSLLEMGCDAFQGYFFGRPMDVGQLMQTSYFSSLPAPDA